MFNFYACYSSGREGKAWEPRVEPKQHILVPPFSLTFVLWVEVIVQKSWDGVLSGSAPALQGLGPAAFTA